MATELAGLSFFSRRLKNSQTKTMGYCIVTKKKNLLFSMNRRDQSKSVFSFVYLLSLYNLVDDQKLLFALFRASFSFPYLLILLLFSHSNLNRPFLLYVASMWVDKGMKTTIRFVGNKVCSMCACSLEPSTFFRNMGGRGRPGGLAQHWTDKKVKQATQQLYNTPQSIYMFGDQL